MERRDEQLAGRRVDLADRLLQREARLRQVRPLRREEVEALHLVLVLLDRERVDGPERLDLLAQRLRLRAQRVVVQLDRVVRLQQVVHRCRVEDLGFDKVSVGQIAASAGVSVPTFYAHYPS